MLFPTSLRCNWSVDELNTISKRSITSPKNLISASTGQAHSTDGKRAKMLPQLQQRRPLSTWW